jgi:hypothetical protein
MQPCINQSISRKGEPYHIQTEDGGKNNPFVTTVLFKGGVVVSSKRTGYADILKSDKLDIVLRELMTEQHASLVKALEEGQFDRGAEAGREAGEKKKEPIKETRMVADEKNKAPPVDKESLEDFVLECLSLKR